MIDIESQLYGGRLTEEAEENISENLKKVDNVELPKVIDVLVANKIESKLIWDRVRKTLLYNMKSQTSVGNTAHSLVKMGPHIANKRFLKALQPFVLDNLNIYNFETLLSLRNNFIVAQTNKLVARSDKISSENMTFLSCLEMRLSAILITFGRRNISLRNFNFVKNLVKK